MCQVDYDDFVLDDKRTLEEFEDVAADEKEFMHLWNIFVQRHPIYSDGCAPLPLAPHWWDTMNVTQLGTLVWN
jgi:hypothetical protein